MKELLANAANLFYRKVDSEFVPHVEIVLVVCEPEIKINTDGKLVSSDGEQSYRFTTTAENLRKIALSFLEVAKDADGKESV